MASIRLEDVSPFGRLALKLDQDFTELDRLGGQMSRVDLESDSGLDEGVKILNRVALYGQSIAENMQEFAKALQEARDKAETTTGMVAERAQIIQKRRQRQDELQDKIEQLKSDVKTAGEGLAASHEPPKAEPSDEDKRRIAAELERLQAPLDRFIEAAKAIKAEAAAGNYRRLERQADSMIDSLQATRRKIAQAIAPK